MYKHTAYVKLRRFGCVCPDELAGIHRALDEVATDLLPNRIIPRWSAIEFPFMTVCSSIAILIRGGISL